MNTATSSPVRQAALTLHAMAPQDAAWLLQQLPAIEAVELQALLEELRSLGIPSDPRLLDELRLGGGASPVPAVGAGGDVHKLSVEVVMDELAAARADLLLPILKPEPVALLAFLLSTRSWPWADALLAAIETHRRLSLRSQMDSLVSRAGAGHAGNTRAIQLQLTLLRGLLQRYRDATASQPVRDATGLRAAGGFAHWWQERRRFWASIFAPIRAFK